MVFHDKAALPALNNLGTYGEVHVAAARTGTANAEIFASTNLNDRASSCGPFSPSGCSPVPIGGVICLTLIWSIAGSATTSEADADVADLRLPDDSAADLYRTPELVG